MGPPGECSPGVPPAPSDLIPVARVLVAVSDLMLSSRVAEPLRAAGHDVEVRAPVADGGIGEIGKAELVVADLDVADPDAVAASGLPTIGFYAHLDPETGDRGRRAGLDLVIPRSRMARELPLLVERLLD